MKTKAFTLIELAISLSIIGLLVGGSFQAMKAMRERTKRTEAKEQVETAKSAIIGYAIQHNRLPTTTKFYQDLSPIRGAESDQRKKFFYFPYDSINKFTADTNSTTLKVNDSSGTSDNLISNIAFVVAAQSANGNIQTDVVLGIENTVNFYKISDLQDDNSYDFTRLEKYDDIVDWVYISNLTERL